MAAEGRSSVKGIRFITAASIFDGHDAAINIVRRMLQDRAAEVVHLGHNRSVAEITAAAIQEDVHAVAVSSYQGGHDEFFRYLVDELRAAGADHIRIFAGGGGVIVPREIEALHSYGVTRVYSPEDGRRFGLGGIVEDMLDQADHDLPAAVLDTELRGLSPQRPDIVARLITETESGTSQPDSERAVSAAIARRAADAKSVVVGITGTGGSGKSSLIDELIERLQWEYGELEIAALCVDPSKRKTAGALLGDRIRMNSIYRPHVFMRSLATRGSGSELTGSTGHVLDILKAAGFDVIFVESSGIGQGASAVVDVADFTIYVMTSDYGASSQLEKIDMLDFADLVAINKFERRGGQDALREVRAQLRRSKQLGDELLDSSLPVFGTIASQFGDAGVNALYLALLQHVNGPLGHPRTNRVQIDEGVVYGEPIPFIPQHRSHYLGEAAEEVRGERKWVEEQAALARRLYQIDGARRGCDSEAVAVELDETFEKLKNQLDSRCWAFIQEWQDRDEKGQGGELGFEVSEKDAVPISTSLSGIRIPRVVLPRLWDWGDIIIFRLNENRPGEYPFTAGVYPHKRGDEAVRRQFAGEGGPRRTNERFHFLSRNDRAKRLSTAFDSPTLYGEDPAERPDVFCRIGEGGVSVATLDDMKELFAGFDLTDPLTSVSMTINGPAPIILAMFFNTAIDQKVEEFAAGNARQPTADERQQLVSDCLRGIRGTVQADILKEDQAQNECIFSTEFALRMMGDVQQYFVDEQVRGFYSVSVSGYHMGEAGANPITQLAFTLANGLTYAEYFLSRGMAIDDFAGNLSFFFSVGMDPEYSVIGRVARRIWARVMKRRYGAGERSQRFKYHIQTSGRSLQAREIELNDIRTTLEALTAISDNCNSLHTNAYDEAVTIPTADSVRRAVAIQEIIERELGTARNENPLQGSYFIGELTDLVEEAVLAEFDRLDERGGVLGAMELQYQRGRIQEESLLYESRKESGELQVVGVNIFVSDADEGEGSVDAGADQIHLSRATTEERREQVERLRAFQRKHRDASGAALENLKEIAGSGGNIFAELMNTARVASLGQITHALYEAGGRYRRAM